MVSRERQHSSPAPGTCTCSNVALVVLAGSSSPRRQAVPVLVVSQCAPKFGLENSSILDRDHIGDSSGDIEQEAARSRVRKGCSEYHARHPLYRWYRRLATGHRERKESYCSRKTATNFKRTVRDSAPSENIYILLPKKKRSVHKDANKERTTTRHQIKLQVKKGHHPSAGTI